MNLAMNSSCGGSASSISEPLLLKPISAPIREKPCCPSILIQRPAQVAIPLHSSVEPMLRPQATVLAKFPRKPSASPVIFNHFLAGFACYSGDCCSHVALHDIDFISNLLLRWPSGTAERNLRQDCSLHQIQLMVHRQSLCIFGSRVGPKSPPHACAAVYPASANGTSRL